MKTEAHDINQRRLAEAVTSAYGLDLQSIAFLPRGEDAYAYVARDSDDTQHFVRAQQLGRSAVSESTFARIHALRHKSGFEAAVAPYQTHDGSFTISHGRYVVAVFPFIPGRTLYSQGASADDFAAAAEILACLHNIYAEQELPSVERESFDNPFKDPILEALQEIESPSRPSDGLGRRLANLLAAERADVLGTLTMMEELGEQARASTSDSVLTHGDPNLDNWLKDEYGRFHLTDWGELAVGPPERDLFAFSGANLGTFLGPYVKAREKHICTLSISNFSFTVGICKKSPTIRRESCFRILAPQKTNTRGWSCNLTCPSVTRISLRESVPCKQS